ncbi:MAG: XRE family transcriptional regulator [Acidimicrobiaceae bacterium]|nr:XRE family transcriptional regulator [Acidimicrobiaceae bacterium]MDE0494391.1 XRE family transcriptional regulator [Acidimicrobiaceae bacterium]MDE0516967.1 XRE family transcriptional regulator [Acidimicrobiaceae bacterium]
MRTHHGAVEHERPSEPTPVASQLGPALRQRRKAAGMTMQELADRCDLSQPFLSQIENSRAMPSLFALHRVAQALGTTTVALLDPAVSEVTLVRAGEGEAFFLAEGARTRFLTPGEGRRLEANETVAEPNIDSDVIVHEGEEVVHVLEGSLEIRLEGRDPIPLSPGDTVLYPSTTPHQWASGGTGARFLIITSPPSF